MTSTTGAYRYISLGLQGGGSYGAFTWGVLDRILEDERIKIDAISGTSAGAINACAIADGMADGGGRLGAQQALRKFWTGLCEVSRLSPIQRTPLDYLLGRWTLDSSPGYHIMQMMSVARSAWLGMPMLADPIRLTLSSLIDFARVRTCNSVRLFIHATNVRTGRGRLFAQEEMDVQRLMASICVPQLMGAVDVDGEAYWDGSYMGNPALAHLAEPGGARDLVVVQINPVARLDVPCSFADINNRTNEIAFNVSFMREVAAIAQGNMVIDEIGGLQAQPANVRMHLISGTDTIGAYTLSSKYNTEWAFLENLHDLGFNAADRWLAEHFEQIGVASTFTPEALYDDDRKRGMPRG